MYPSGHYGISLILYAPFLATFFLLGQPVLGIAGLTIMVVMATIPDKDLNYWFLPHRGPTHSIWFAALMGIPPAMLFTVIPSDILGIGMVPQIITGWFFGFYGIMGHVLGDALTPTGVRPFWPYGPRYKVHLTTAKGVWWFETIKSGSQERMTHWEQFRHTVLNSNRVFLFIGILATMLASAPYIQST